MSLSKREIGELLIDNGLLTAEQLQQVEKEKQKTGQSISQILTRLGLVTENQLKDTLELQYGVTYVALTRINIDPRTIHLLPESLIRELLILPISRQEDHLSLAMVNPDDEAALEKIKALLHSYQIKAMVCLEDDFQRFVNFYFPGSEPDRVQPIEAKPAEPEIKPVEPPPAPASPPPPPAAPPPPPEPVLDSITRAADPSELGNFLLRRGILNIDQLFDALRSSLTEKKTLAEILVAKQLVTHEKVSELVRQMHSASGTFVLADHAAALDLAKKAGAAQSAQTETNSQEGSNGSEFTDSDDDIDFLNLFKQAPQTPVSLLAHQIINKAVEKKCTDVHIEGRKDSVLVNYLNQGQILEAVHLDREYLPELVASYKLFAGLNASLLNKPQDNKIPMTILNSEIELRITTIPDERQEMVAISIKYLNC